VREEREGGTEARELRGSSFVSFLTEPSSRSSLFFVTSLYVSAHTSSQASSLWRSLTSSSLEKLSTLPKVSSTGRDDGGSLLRRFSALELLQLSSGELGSRKMKE